MKLAIVIENFNPAAGGNERSTLQIAHHLIARGHHVTILANTASNSKSIATAESDAAGTLRILTADGAKTRSAWGLWRFRRWAIRELSRGDFDVSMSVTLAVPGTAVQPRGGTVYETLRQNVAMRNGLPRKILKIVSLALSPKQMALLWFESKTLRANRVRKVIAISQYVADQLFKHYTTPSRRVVHIPNAAEVQFYSPSLQNKKRNHAREAFGLTPSHHVFLFAAMNPRLKGYEQLLQAFKMTLEENSNARLLVAGTTDKKYEEQAKAMGLMDTVCFVGRTKEMDALYLACDVLVHPTWYDPSSKVVLEALLHGRPAITTRYNGAAQWIYDPHGQMRLFSPLIEAGSVDGHRLEPIIPAVAGAIINRPDDVNDLAKAMITLCDRDIRQRCASATHVLSKHITMQVHVDALEALLLKLAADLNPDTFAKRFVSVNGKVMEENNVPSKHFPLDTDGKDSDVKIVADEDTISISPRSES